MEIDLKSTKCLKLEGIYQINGYPTAIQSFCGQKATEICRPHFSRYFIQSSETRQISPKHLLFVPLMQIYPSLANFIYDAPSYFLRLFGLLVASSPKFSSTVLAGLVVALLTLSILLPLLAPRPHCCPVSLEQSIPSIPSLLPKRAPFGKSPVSVRSKFKSGRSRSVDSAGLGCGGK